VLTLLLLASITVIGSVLIAGVSKSHEAVITTPESNLWQAPDIHDSSFFAEGDLIPYGRDLIVNTSYYLGPKGKVAAISNGMNCQNCHLDAGTRHWGNNYSAVYSTYPKFRERSGSIETISKRINDCIERSLNGKKLDTNSKEIKAIYAYMKWLGQNVEKNTKPPGVGIADLHFLGRPADTLKGKIVFYSKCQRCHGSNGEGVWKQDSSGFIYPPLWGKNSYGTAAGLYRISRFAGLVRDNMPFGASHNLPELSEEEAWDVAAFVNSKPRPIQTFKEDWPDYSKKPFDLPFGPYSDKFSSTQHKYGPFAEIILYRDSLNRTDN
jgi:thiosulfate dehydrogenase